MDVVEHGRTRWILGHVLLYVLWIATTGLAVLTLFVSRSFYLAFMGTVGVGFWTWGFLDKALLIVVGIGILILVISTEFYYASGLAQGKLLKRAARMIGIELLVLCVCHLFLATLAGTNWTRTPGFLLGLIEGLAGTALFVLSLLPGRGRGALP